MPHTSGHNDTYRDEALQLITQADHQREQAVAILKKKARSDTLDARDARVAFDPLDSVEGRLALALGDLVGAIHCLLGHSYEHDHRGPTGQDE